MEIVRACSADFEAVKGIAQDTIAQIYPHYYPSGAVEFFQKHHSDSAIMTDILDEKVYVLKDGGKNIGTVTIAGDEINRLFVLPDFQGRGYGSALMDFAEKIIFEQNTQARLHASLPGKKLYVKRGYREDEYRTKMVEHEDWLCVDIMKKDRL